MKTCENCGERVYDLGCTWCNELAYIEQQAAEDGTLVVDSVVDPVVRAQHVTSTRDAKSSHYSDLAAALRASSADTETK